MAPKQDTQAYIKSIAEPPPPGTPYALPIPGTERPNRTAIYRHWRFQNGPLLETFDPAHQSIHDLFEASVAKVPNRKCLGWRPWNSTTKTWEPKYVWMTYSQVAERRKNLGAGIVELQTKRGITGTNYGVGLWAQNRPEWAITGMSLPICAMRIPLHLESMANEPFKSSPCSRSLSTRSLCTRLSVPRPPSTSSTTAA